MRLQNIHMNQCKKHSEIVKVVNCEVTFHHFLGQWLCKQH